MTAAFDPQAYSDELQAAGVPREQASIHARAWMAVCRHIDGKFGFLSSEIAGLRADFNQLRADLNQLRADLNRLKADFDIFKVEIRSDIEKLRVELWAEIAKLRVEMDSIRSELKLHRWALGALLAISTSNLALTLRYVVG